MILAKNKSLYIESTNLKFLSILFIVALLLPLPSASADGKEIKQRTKVLAGVIISQKIL